MWRRYYSIILLPSTMIGAVLRLVSCGVLVVLVCGTILFGHLGWRIGNPYPELISEWCPDERRSIGDTWETIRIHNLESMEPVWDMRLGSEVTYGISFSPDSNTLLVEGIPVSGYYPYPGNSLWHLRNGCITRISSAQFSNTFVEFSHESNSLLVTILDNRRNCDSRVHKYSGTYFWLNLSNREQTGPFSFAKFVETPDGERLSVIHCHNSNNTRQLIDASTGQIDFSAPQFFANARTVSPNNQYYITTQKDGVVSLWRINGNEHIWDFPPGEEDDVFGEVMILEFSPDSRWLVLRRGIEEHVWDIETGKHIIKSGGWRHPQFSPDSQLFAHWDTVWDLPTGYSKYELDGTFRSFSPDGKFFAAINNNTVEFRLSANGETLYTLDVGRDVKDVAFSPDGRFVAIRTLERPPENYEGHFVSSHYAEIWGIPEN